MFSSCAPSPAVKLDISVTCDAAIVLLVKVCEPESVATVASIAISLAFAVIPVPPTTFKVTAPELPPPVKPSPAVTPDISPVADEREIQFDPS